MKDKPQLRLYYKNIRAKDTEKEKTDKIISEKVLNCDLLKNADSVFCYCSVKDEVDTSQIISALIKRKIKVALPVCLDSNGTMCFYYIDSLSELKTGFFSVREPDSEKCEKAIPSENTLCLVPALSFDKKGYRLGYGKGYYDRFLKNFNGKSLGLCRENCLCDNLPKGEYDKSVDYVITENIYKFNSKEE